MPGPSGPTFGGALAAPSLPKVPSHASGVFAPSSLAYHPTAHPGVPSGGLSDANGPGGYALPAPPAAPKPAQTPYLADPGYQSAVNSQTQGNQDLQALLNKALSQALIGYGSPALAGSLSQYGYTLNPEDSAAAQANYQSGNATLARLDQAHSLGQQGVVNNLTAHGLAASGDLGYRTQQVDQQYGHNVYDAQQSLLGQLGQYQQQVLTQKQQLQANVDAALQHAWDNVVANPGAYTTPANQPAAPKAPVKGVSRRPVLGDLVGANSPRTHT